ncbi:ABC transporter substrate-binding protein [Piscinibacter sp. HJYY11]|uniref:ABC transporter substrate-binding protein n=1 Tax=Piscinibacter sp. HJYY11 TaxID=2801333 RepID=UPI00191FF763|nr:ABC transporter substrate-binding protein [Piscinibacter sp. HJYY11]MBL0727092.1 ABC transporter substrate-binding protein [Piscinibacter sp. HJYY11]
MWFKANATRAVLAAIGLLASTLVSAQIRIGQTTGVTGPAAGPVKEINQGAMLYIDFVNSEGGINGQQIEVVTLDDKNQVPNTVENTKQLIADPKVVALFLNRGTPHAQAMLPLLTEARIVLLAPSTGAISVHKPVHPYVFNVRATYQREAEHVTRHLGMGGLERVGICYVDDPFGQDALQGALNVFKTAGKQTAFNEALDKFKPDYSKCVAKALETKPLGILMISTAASVATGVKALRQAGSKVTVATLSNNAAKGFVDALGEHASGVIVSQVFPSERRLASPMIAEAARLAQAKGIKQLTPAMIEGYAASKVLVLALRRAAQGKEAITRASFKKALESFNRVDIGAGVGGTELTYTPTDHSGLDYVDLSYIGDDGSFRR